jgi:hypothetical protein
VPESPRQDDHATVATRDADGHLGSFLITIDTEGDDLWARPRDITTRNAAAVPRFQELCERYGMRPTYLVNWEMTRSDAFVDFGRSVLARDAAEIGMHLHAWNSPPIVPLTDDDFAHQPYLIEYPTAQMREKVKVMTDTLQTLFASQVVSHRAGRWGLDETYAGILAEAGYRVDCSVTPLVDWSTSRGDPNGSGGPDFRAFPDHAYFMDLDDISREGSSGLLQVPMTVIARSRSSVARTLGQVARRVPRVNRYANALLPAVGWLRPNGRNGRALLRTLRVAADERRDYVEFMLHSSELMAGGSPTFPTVRSIDTLYEHMEALFEAAQHRWKGTTLREYHAMFTESSGSER